MSAKYAILGMFWVSFVTLLIMVTSAKKSRTPLAGWLNGHSEYAFLVFIISTVALAISGTLLLLSILGIVPDN